MTRVSRQIRKETISIFYGDNSFAGDIIDFDCSHVEKWIEQIGRENDILVEERFLYQWKGFGPSWRKNIMTWMENYFTRNWCIPLRSEQPMGASPSPFLKLFEISNQLENGGFKWTDAKPILENVCDVVEAHPP